MNNYAVETRRRSRSLLVVERANIQPPLFVSENVPMEKKLLLPKKNQDDHKVIAYLL